MRHYDTYRDGSSSLAASSQETTPILNFLIVEDESLNRQLLLAIFTHLGHRVLEACDGQEALRILEGTPGIDAVLLDLHMARMDGYSVLRHLRAQPSTEALPVICISAHARREDQDRAQAAGADAYVVKPFRRRELIAAIDGVLVRKGALAPGQTIAPS